MTRLTSAIIAAAAAVTIVPSTHADFLAVYGASAATPAGATIFSTTVPVANAAGDGVGVFNVSYSLTTSAILATRFNASGTVESLGALGASGTARPTSSVTTVTAGGLALGYSSEASSTSSTRAVYWLPGSTTPTRLESINDFSAAVPGQSSGVANAINASGLIVGSSGRYSDDGFSGLGTRAVYWAAGSTTPTELGNLGTTAGAANNTGTTYAAATAVNASGTIAGYAKVGGGYNNSSTTTNTHAARWTTATTSGVTPAAVDLGVINYSNGDAATGSSNSVATAMNAAGTIIGNSLRYDLARYNAAPTTGSPPNGPTGPNGLVGYAIGTRAVRWAATDTTPTELSPLNTTTFDVYNSRAFTYVYAGTGAATANDINDSGTTVGVSTLYAPQTAATSGSNLTPSTYGTRAVTWAAGSTTPVELPFLGTLASGTTTSTFANAVNEDNVIAGTAYLNGATATQRGVVWRADRSLVNLNDLINPAAGYVLTSATSISEGLTTNSYTVTGLSTYTAPGTTTTATRAYLVNVPRPMYFANGVGGDLAAVTGGQTNFATNLAGTNISTMLPTGGNDVFFASSNAASLGTTLGGNFAVNSLTFGTGANAAAPVTIGGTGTLTLNAGLSVVYNAGVGILKNAGAAAVTINAPLALATNQTWTNNSATALTVGNVGLGSANLTLAGSGAQTINGVVSGSGTVLVTGSGPVTLGGANTSTGTTTINNAAGTLIVSESARPAALGGGGTNVIAGQVQFDYVAANPTAAIRGLLAASYTDTATPGVVDTGLLRSSTATAAKGIGYRDTGTTVLVKVALFGDADLDGGVSINDFNALAGNFGVSSGKVWTDGDFDYDGGVSINDFNLLAGGFGQSLPAGSPMWSGLLAFAAAHNDLAAFEAVTGVPEPTTLGLIGIAATLGLRRRTARR